MDRSTSRAQGTPVSDRQRVLVTGSSGFVGTHIVRTLIDAGYEVAGADIDEPMAGAEPLIFRRCDLTSADSLEQIVEHERPAAIVHAAAITPAYDERARAREIVLVNQLSTLTALTAAAKHGCGRVVFLSSAGVYRDPPIGTVLDEQSDVAYNGGLYAQTKLASERLCAWATRELGISTVALRVGPVYGEHERPTTSRQGMSPIYRAIQLALQKEPIRCNALDTSYNFIYGDDVGGAVVAALRAHEPGSVYNVAGSPTTMTEMLAVLTSVTSGTEWSQVEDVSDVNLPVSLVSRPMSSALIRNELGFSVQTDLRGGISRTVNALMY